MQGFDVCVHETLAQHQILRWVTGDRQFRKEEDIGLTLLRPGHRLADDLGVAVDVADGEIRLGTRHAEEVGHANQARAYARRTTGFSSEHCRAPSRWRRQDIPLRGEFCVS